LGPPVPSSRPHPASQDLEPRRPAQPSTPRRAFGWSQEQIVQEVRRQWEARQAEKRRQAAEHRARAAQQREVIQYLKLLVVDMYFTLEPIPLEARAEAKVAIERELRQLPLLELPLLELQQIGNAIRDKVFAQYRTVTVPITVLPPRPSTPAASHPQQKEITVPIYRVLSGYFECPLCNEEYELDRVPEREAVCEECHVKLEKVDEEDDDAE
jgi:hypothetical protein